MKKIASAKNIAGQILNYNPKKRMENFNFHLTTKRNG